MQAKKGDKIAVHYTGRLESGKVFDSSIQNGRPPLEFVIGSGMVIKGFDDGVTGMSIGEKKTVHIPFMDAYGPSDPQNTVTLPRTQLPPDLNSELFVGMSLNMHQENGHVVTVNVTNLTETDVTLDANHELAGKDLIFDLELMAIN